MNEISVRLNPDAEQLKKIFGMQDAYVKKLERDFKVTIVDRNGSIIITGPEENVNRAASVLRQLTILAERGNEIEEQNVDYAIAMGMESTANI